MAKGRVLISVTLLMLLLCLIGCSEQHADLSKTQQPSAPPTLAGGGFALPAPAMLLSGMDRPRGVSAALLVRSGSDFVPGAVQLATAEGAGARFSPAWTDASAGFDTLAYAIYRFNLEGVTDTNAITLAWDAAPGDYVNLWIGLSRWNNGRWEWFAGPVDGTLELGAEGSTPYSEPGTADMFVAVVLVGTAEAVLQQVELNGNLLPVAALTADPTSGLAPLDVSFDASGSSDIDGSIVKYEWKWDDAVAGPWDFDSGTTATATHQYPAGTYQAWVRVTDNDGMTDTASASITVTEDPWRGDWWMFGHDRKHTRRSPFTGPATNTLKWYYTAGDGVASSPAIGADGTLYVGSNDDKLYAINPDGSFKWSYTTGASVISSPAVGADGTLYVGSVDGKLYAINPDGSFKWSYTTVGQVVACPAIGTDGTVYVGLYDANKLYAINPDGSLQWDYTTGGQLLSSPAVGADGTLYVGSDDGKLYAINLDGSLQWDYTTGGRVIAPAIGTDGTVYVGSYDNKLYAINPDGSLKWSYTTGDMVRSSPAIDADGVVYVGSDDYKLYAINPDGSLKWSYTTGDMVRSCPAIGADGTVYVGSYDYKLYAINPDGNLKWSYTAGNIVYSSPAIGADGTVYVGSHDYKLYAIGPGGV